jgi:hypothetical protein
MYHINTINFPHQLIENNHLNFYNIQFDDESLLTFINKMNKCSFICQMVDNIRSSQEFTDYQKELMNKCFPNLKIYNTA